MSTRSSLRSGENFHLFEECFDRDAVWLELSGCEFEAAPGQVAVRIPLAIWEHVRDATIAQFDLVDLNDEALEQHVRELWSKRQEMLRNEPERSILRFVGAMVWGVGSPDEQLAHGLEWHLGERERQRVLRTEIDALKRPDRGANDEKETS